MTPVVLVPHRAIYDLSLGETRGNSQIAGVRGRILYDFDGNACEGYSLEFRQVSELDTGEGKVSTSDLRSTTWEGADAKSTNSRRRIMSTKASSIRSTAMPNTIRDKTAVDSRQSREQKSLDLDAGVVFPTEHMVRVIKAARDGKTILNFPVYDGSETGEKVFDTLTVIGHKIAPDERKHDDAAAGEPKLAAVPRWPVTISYFDKTKSRRKQRADAGLCDQLRALRERHFARADARLQRLHRDREAELAGNQRRQAVSVALLSSP